MLQSELDGGVAEQGQRCVELSDAEIRPLKEPEVGSVEEGKGLGGAKSGAEVAVRSGVGQREDSPHLRWGKSFVHRSHASAVGVDELYYDDGDCGAAEERSV